MVLALDVLEHIKEDNLALREIARVLKDGGYFVFTVPAFSFMYSGYDKFLKHHRRYGMREVKEGIGSIFKIVDTGYWNFFLFIPIVLMHVSNKMCNTNPRPEIHPYLRKIFRKILQIENMIIKTGFHFPFGISIYGIMKKACD